MVKPDELMMAAGKLALMIAAGKVPRRVTSKLNDKIGSYEMAKAVIETGRAGALKKNRNLPQPFAYLDAVEAGVRDGFEAGLDKEITLMAGLVMHPVAKSLMVRRTESDGGGMCCGGLRGGGVICPSVLISHRRHSAFVFPLLQHFFFATRATTKGMPNKFTGKPIQTVAVLGGGTMGAGICIVYLLKVRASFS